jgi:hypothetical protein
MTHDPNGGGFIDGNRSCSLHYEGGHNLLAAALVGVDGTYLAVVDSGDLLAPLLDPLCREVAHEQLGCLPPDIVKRIWKAPE